ncbi:MAG: hypothetical protein L0Z50_36945 [Verrucomicrobiales bacterium]|nr:hypothetical protein [Verrucomicrobiales bacterium]
MLSQQQFEELRDAMCDAIREAVVEALSPHRDRLGAARYLKLSPMSIDVAKRRGKLKPKFVGDKPLYPIEQLDALKTSEPTILRERDLPTGNGSSDSTGRKGRRSV